MTLPVAQLRLRDFTLFKVMLTAILVGGLGVFIRHSGGLAAYHIKPANLLAVALGAVLFGVGMASSAWRLRLLPGNGRDPAGRRLRPGAPPGPDRHPRPRPPSAPAPRCGR